MRFNWLKSLVFLGVSIIATFLALILAFISAGAGHGDYFFVKLLFPYTMLSTIAFNEITLPFIIFGLFQFPIYSLTLSLAENKKNIKFIGLLILGIHLSAVIICFISIGSNFS